MKQKRVVSGKIKDSPIKVLKAAAELHSGGLSLKKTGKVYGWSDTGLRNNLLDAGYKVKSRKEVINERWEKYYLLKYGGRREKAIQLYKDGYNVPDAARLANIPADPLLKEVTAQNLESWIVKLKIPRHGRKSRLSPKHNKVSPATELDILEAFEKAGGSLKIRGIIRRVMEKTEKSQSVVCRVIYSRYDPEREERRRQSYIKSGRKRYRDSEKVRQQKKRKKKNNT